MASKEQEKQMAKTLSTLLRQLYELEAIAGDFTQPNSQPLLLTRLQEFMLGLEQFRKLAANYDNIQVPTSLLKFIDAGGHPDDYVRDTFRAAVADNQVASGRVVALQAMLHELAGQASAAFPQEAALYEAVVAQKQPELQQHEQQLQQQQQSQAQAGTSMGTS